MNFFALPKTLSEISLRGCSSKEESLAHFLRKTDRIIVERFDSLNRRIVQLDITPSKVTTRDSSMPALESEEVSSISSTKVGP